MNIVFIFALILLALTIYRGAKRGLIGLLYGVGSWIFIGLFVLLVNPLLYNAMYNSSHIHDALYDKLYPYVDEKVPGYTGDTGIKFNQIRATSQEINTDNIDIDEIKRKIDSGEIEIPEEYKPLLEDIDLEEYKDVLEEIDISEYKELLEDEEIKGEDGVVTADELIKGIKKVAGDASEKIRTQIVETTTEKACQYFIKFLAVLISYIISKIITVTVKYFLYKYFEEGVIGDVVHVAGGIIGAAEGILYLWIMMYGVSMIRMISIGQTIYQYIQENPLLKVLYENNGFAIFLDKL